MGDMGDLFNAVQVANKVRKDKNLSKANPDGWIQHTEYHWSKTLNDKRLDYWPSRNKFQYEGKVMCGDINNFIKKRSK